MPVCPKCSAQITPEQTTCPACGSGIGDESATAIRPADDTPTEIKETDSPKSHTTPQGTCRFLAGTILARRYRILTLLGQGGMGEVYKAEDLELEQTVALKFLPEELSTNERLLSRFKGEVRTARQVSHPNVCRVYDLGEAQGLYYISMEYIDGDDLSVLLRRIGRLPSDKAVEISREIAMGLNAVHSAGILHRDLKPANIIIDSNGKARITDFGIAGIEADVQGAEARVGTPAYMSPEQVTGKEVTQRSDIYSLGLLIYEIFTGKQAFEGESIHELLAKQTTATPTNPSEIVTGIDPVVENLIEKCLAKDPDERPSSALQVAMMLPGGDPMRVALEAGKTPTPEMVAAAPTKGALKLPIALALFAGFVALFFLTTLVKYGYQTFSIVPMKKSPEVLTDRSRELLKQLGVKNPPGDEASEFSLDMSFLRFYPKNMERPGWPGRKEILASGWAGDSVFIYRRSPEPLSPGSKMSVAEDVPPLNEPGMINVKLDTVGRLLEFTAVPPKSDPGEAAKDVDWSAFLSAAGYDPDNLEETTPVRVPPVFGTKRIAWKGSVPGFPMIPVTIEGAELEGRPVYFSVFPPWSGKDPDVNSSQNASEKSADVLFIVLFWVAMAAALFLAYRNLKGERVDLWGGLWLTAFVFATMFVGYLILADHVTVIAEERDILFAAAGFAVSTAILIGVMYIALEPIVRRSWPELLISWSRLMAGGYRDPMVGRDILAGGILGICWVLTIYGGRFLAASFQYAPQDGLNPQFPRTLLEGYAGIVGYFFSGISESVAYAIFVVFVALLLYLLTGRKSVGLLLLGILFVGLVLLGAASRETLLMKFFTVSQGLLLVTAVGRFGLLGTISYWFFFWSLWRIPVTFDPSTFFFPQSVFAVVSLLAIGTWAFYISFGRSVRRARAIG